MSASAVDVDTKILTNPI